MAYSNPGQVPSIPADGSMKVLVVPEIADPNAPTVTELTAATVADVSCYLTGDGWNPSLDEQTVDDPRLCSRQVYEQPGSFTRGLETTYIDNTNSEYEAEFNKAKDTLTPGTAMYVVERRGKDFEDEITAGDKVWVWPIKPGQYNPLPKEDNSVWKITQKQFVTGKVSEDVEVVAAA